MITRKLHCVHNMKDGTLSIAICVLDDIERPRELVSSNDGIVAMEVHTQAKPTQRGWRTFGKRTIELAAGELSDTARRAALAAFAEPDVDACVVDVGSIRHVFTRDDRGVWSRHDGTRQLPTYVFERPIV